MFILADYSEALEFLSTPDEYTKRLAPWEMAMRMHRSGRVKPELYYQHLARTVQQWTADEQLRLKEVLAVAEELLNYWLSPDFPDVYLLKSNGRDEWHGAYTRNRVIILPESKLLELDDEELLRLVIHETFHVFSRFNQEFRPDLYALIGFRHLPDAGLPPEILRWRVTNPDTGVDEFAIRVTADGKIRDVVPCILVKDEFRQSGFTRLKGSLDVKFVAVDSGESYAAEELDQFFQQVGENTDYILHPEEILAENFVHLVMEDSDLPSPWVIERLGSFMQQCRRRFES